MLQAGYATPQRETPHTGAQGKLTRAPGFPKGVRLIPGFWTAKFWVFLLDTMAWMELKYLCICTRVSGYGNAIMGL